MTKTYKQNKCREILHKYNPGEIVNNSDLFFLISVFENHSEWDKKKGEGILNISIGLAQFGTRCFIINRTDGSSTDISFLKAITNPSEDSDLKKACRSAIQCEIDKFKDENLQYGITRCAITNEILLPNDTHIDHYDLTFSEVYNEWIKYQNKKYLVSKLNKSVDNETETYFIDDKINYDFRIFHNMNTHLRAVTKYANLVLLKNK